VLFRSNYFRFLEGPGSTTIHGREFVVPTDSLSGHIVQLVTFDTAPIAGDFVLTYGVVDTPELGFDATSGEVQTALRTITGLEAVTVSGSVASGFTVVFVGVQIPPLLTYDMGVIPLTDADLEEVDLTIAMSGYSPWDKKLLRGDKIIDSVYGSMAVDEIIEIPDMGGGVMGYRIRCE